jgi:hypothetical protein
MDAVTIIVVVVVAAIWSMWLLQCAMHLLWHEIILKFYKPYKMTPLYHYNIYPPF